MKEKSQPPHKVSRATNHHFRVVGCFVEYQGRFLTLHRNETDPEYGGTWCLVSGGVNPGETDHAAMLRELKEEIGYTATPEQLEFMEEASWNLDNGVCDFVVFRLKLDGPIEVHHNKDEHSEFRWVTPQECYAMKNLIHGFHELLERWYGCGRTNLAAVS